MPTCKLFDRGIQMWKYFSENLNWPFVAFPPQSYESGIFFLDILKTILEIQISHFSGNNMSQLFFILTVYLHLQCKILRIQVEIVCKVCLVEDTFLTPSNTFLAPSNTFLTPSNTFLTPSNTFLTPSNTFLTPVRYSWWLVRSSWHLVTSFWHLFRHSKCN